jgi:Ca-activated chloride channel family protein
MTHPDETPSAVLRDRAGNRIALQGVAVCGSLTETLVSIQVEQRYHNAQPHNIEAVYTFPLPMGAVLLALEVEIAGQKLVGQVIEKKAAEQRYEEAITDGNSAVMVQALGNGLYSMNVGNLMAGESAVIRYRYALTLSWQGDQLRLTIPTTIAPRYGDTAASGLEPWQIPTSSVMVEYPFTLTVSIDDKLADADIASPTHSVSMTRTEQGLTVTLDRQATLDRDFVLTAKATKGHENSCLVANDGEQRVALATLRIPPIIETDRLPLCLKIVIDCSASMAGVSIAQARKAALAMLDLLKPEDSFNVTLFGLEHEHLFDRMVAADARHIDRARARLNGLDANMGGTETGAALAAAYKLKGNASVGMLDRLIGRTKAEPFAQPAVLLITDGAIFNMESVIAAAAKSGHRVFTVGVGLSAASYLVTSLANVTGAACELVSPQEGMADKLLAQFHRLQQPMFGQAELLWDVAPAWQTPIPAVLFAGDTIQVYAGFENEAPSTVRLHMPNTSVDTSAVSATAEPVELPDIPRLAAHARIAMNTDEAEQIRLAVTYQLLTERTNFLVVSERQEKADDLPMLHPVPQMMAAGWGGTGIDRSRFAHSERSVATSVDCAMGTSSDFPAVVRKSSVKLHDALVQSGVDRSDIPPFLRANRDAVSASAKPEPDATTRALTPVAFIAALNPAMAGLVNVSALPSTVETLRRFGLPAEIGNALTAVSSKERPERHLVAAFLYALSESCLAEYFERGLTRLIVTHWKRLSGDQQLIQWCAQCLLEMELHAWNWKPIAIIAETVVKADG